MFTAFPAHAQPTILHIWQGVHSIGDSIMIFCVFSLRCGLRLPRLTYIRSCSKNRHQWTDSEVLMMPSLSSMTAPENLYADSYDKAGISMTLGFQCTIGMCESPASQHPMMTLSNGNIFRITGPFWWESTGHRWIPLTKPSQAEIWCFLLCAPEQTVKQTVELLVISLRRHCNAHIFYTGE